MWEHLASVLRGDKEQTFNIYTGCGRNGNLNCELWGWRVNIRDQYHCVITQKEVVLAAYHQK